MDRTTTCTTPPPQPGDLLSGHLSPSLNFTNWTVKHPIKQLGYIIAKSQPPYHWSVMKNVIIVKDIETVHPPNYVLLFSTYNV